jgi:UDP-2,3-diacylglucosamine hydrolase
MAAMRSPAVPPADVSNPAGPLAIVCGGGAVPIAVAEAVTRSGRRVVLFPVRGWADPKAVEKYPHHWIAVVQAGRFVKHARAEGCRDVVLLGAAVRPPFWSLRLDWTTLRILPAIYRSYRGGDDHLLSGVSRLFQEHGFRIVGPHEVAPEILIPSGRIGSLAPSQRDLSDIARGLDLLRAIGPFDVGQAAVVANNQVLTVEGIDGTDSMLARIAELRERGRIPTARGVGVLVKAPKPGQDRRLDMPAIGPKTVEAAARAGLAGIAVVAGSTIIAEPTEVARAADAAGLFVHGIDEQPQ